MNALSKNIPDHIQNSINDFVHEVNRVFGDKIEKIYLHGFYISGNFNKISEINLIIVIDVENRDEYKKIVDGIYDIEYNLEEKYGFNWYFDIDFCIWDNMDNEESIILYEKNN